MNKPLEGDRGGQECIVECRHWYSSSEGWESVGNPVMKGRDRHHTRFTTTGRFLAAVAAAPTPFGNATHKFWSISD